MAIGIESASPAAWIVRDYISPGLQVVRPDAAFPHMRAGDALRHSWKYLRRDVPHIWYCDERFPEMGFLNRDEAVLLHNIALQFRDKPALEIGSWLGWSTCHLALAGVALDVIDPANEDALIRQSVELALERCGVADRVNLIRGRSPEAIAQIGRRWNLFFIDGDHERPAPLRDTMACLPYAADDCAFVFHDLAAPAVASAVRFLARHGFKVLLYQTAQIMAIAWRGNVSPVAHTPDPEVAWQIPEHLADLPVCGRDLAIFAKPHIRQFRDVFTADEPAAAMPSVCLVTSEFVGLFKNGGIGTATSGLAEVLADAGAQVTVLYTGGVWGSSGSEPQMRKRYADRGITIDALSLDDVKDLGGPVAQHSYVAPWLVHRYLAARRFDVVHFNDCCGEGSLALAAKALGIGFDDTLLVVGLHSPSRWVLDANQTLASTPVLAAFDYAERLSVASADVLWSPSEYLLDWAAARGFRLPEQTFLQQYAIPAAKDAAVSGERTRVKVKEIVFFGRLEERKGLRLFCNAVDALRNEIHERQIAVTFLGKPERCAGMDSIEYIARHRAQWPLTVQLLTELGQPEALAHLQRDGVLAVVPSPLDNSPCTVYEALAYRIPLLAARTGGIPELIDPDDRERVLFDYGTDGLVNALRDAMEHGGWIARPAVPQPETRRAWRAMHDHWRELLPARRRTVARSVTVAAIIDHPPGAPLHITLDSLCACTAVQHLMILDRAGERLVPSSIDLTATDPEAVAADLAAMTEDIVVLIHSGVAVLPELFQTMVEALGASNAGGVQPAGRVTGREHPEIVVPLGGSAPFSLVEGATFTGALAVRREVLVSASADRDLIPDAPFLGLADFVVASGAAILPYPEVVLERDTRVEVKARSSSPARIAAYQNVSANDRYYMLAAAYGTAEDRSLSARVELARFAARRGLSFAVRAGAAVWRRVRRWTH